MVDTMLAIRAVMPVASSAGKAISVPPPATAIMAPATNPAAATSSAETGVTCTPGHRSWTPRPGFSANRRWIRTPRRADPPPVRLKRRSAAGAGRAEVAAGARPGELVGLRPVVASVVVLHVADR